eukprot:gene30585-39853_t
MSWFGGSKKKEEPIPEVHHYVGDDDADDFHDPSFNSSSSFPSGPSLHGLSNGQSNESFAEALAVEQQKAMVQAVVFKLTDIAFDECVPKPSSSLSSSEQSCISSIVGKYVESSQLIVGRLGAAMDQQR